MTVSVAPSAIPRTIPGQADDDKSFCPVRSEAASKEAWVKSANELGAPRALT